MNKRIYSNHGFDPLLTGMTVEHDNQYTNESYPYKLNLHLSSRLFVYADRLCLFGHKKKRGGTIKKPITK